MFTTVCLNPAFDKTVEVDNLMPGATNRIRSIRVDPGGKGVNVAVVAARLGSMVQCAMLSGVEDETVYHSYLQQNGVEPEIICVPGRIRTNTKIVSRADAVTTELNEPGIIAGQQWQERLCCTLGASESALVIYSGSLPRDCSSETYRILAKRAAKPFILDAEGESLVKCLSLRPLLVKPNIEELSALFGCELHSHHDIRCAAEKLIDQGAQHVCVSMGAKGAMLIDQTRALLAEPIAVKAESTVGAGDAMIAGFAYGYEVTGSIMNAFAYAVAAGTASVMTKGTGLVEKQTFDALLSKVVIREMDPCCGSFAGHSQVMI